MSKAAFPWFKIHLLEVATDLNDVKSLDGEGAYFRMLRHLWMNGPQTKEELQRRCKKTWTEIQHVFSMCSTGEEQLFSVRWLEDQRGKAETGREKWKKAGEASAAARRAKSKKKNKRSTNEEQALNECSTDVEHSISISSSISSDTQEKERASDLPFTSPRFRQAFADFEIMRKADKHPYTAAARRMILTKCERFGEAVAIEALNNSTRSGWRDVYEPKSNGQTKPLPPKPEKLFTENM